MRFDAIKRLWDRLRASGGDPEVLDSDSFTDSERAVGRLVLPLLSDLDEAKRTIEDLTNRTRALEVALDLLSVPAIVVDSDGRFLTSNKHARSLFGGVAVPASVLAAANRAIHSGTEHEATLLPPARQGEVVRAVPADVAAADRQGDDPSVVFLVTESRPSNEIAPQVLVTRLGLTPAQSRVLSLVALGMTNREISAQLNISAETVHTHLAAIYQRLGVANRAAAVAAAYGAS